MFSSAVCLGAVAILIKWTVQKQHDDDGKLATSGVKERQTLRECRHYRHLSASLNASIEQVRSLTECFKRDVCVVVDACYYSHHSCRNCVVFGAEMNEFVTLMTCY
jgi:hypothetical protein